MTLEEQSNPLENNPMIRRYIERINAGEPKAKVLNNLSDAIISAVEAGLAETINNPTEDVLTESVSNTSTSLEIVDRGGESIESRDSEEVAAEESPKEVEKILKRIAFLDQEIKRHEAEISDLHKRISEIRIKLGRTDLLENPESQVYPSQVTQEQILDELKKEKLALEYSLGHEQGSVENNEDFKKRISRVVDVVDEASRAMILRMRDLFQKAREDTSHVGALQSALKLEEFKNKTDTESLIQMTHKINKAALILKYISELRYTQLDGNRFREEIGSLKVYVQHLQGTCAEINSKILPANIEFIDQEEITRLRQAFARLGEQAQQFSLTLSRRVNP